MNWLQRLVGREQSGAARSRLHAELRALFEEHGLSAFERQLQFADLAGDRDWALDQETGQLRLGDDLVFAAQILGTTSAGSGTWLWSWANPSIDEGLKRRASELQGMGQERGIAAFTAAELDLGDIGDGHLLALVASGVLAADAYFRGTHDGGEVYVLVDAPQIRTASEPAEPRAIATILQAQLGLPFPISREAVSAYLRALGLPIRVSGGQVVTESERAATFRFDRHGRLTEILQTAEAEVGGRPPAPQGVPLRDWQDATLEDHPGWRDSRGESPVDVLRRYQEGRHAWEKEARRAGERRWPEMKERLAALYEQVATARPIEARDTQFSVPASRDPRRARIVSVAEPRAGRVTIVVEEDNPTGLLTDSYEVTAVLVNGVWRLKDRVAVFEHERIAGLL